MRFDYRAFLVGLVVGSVITFFLTRRIVKEIKVPFKVEVKVPVIEKEFDTVYLPKPIYKPIVVVDTDLVNKYKKANDSLKKELFEKAVTVRDYKEVFEDDIQTITVDINVTGKLNSVFAKYVTKPRTIIIDTLLTVDVPDYSRPISVYGEVGMPTKNYTQATPVLKAGFDISNKKNLIWGGSFDTEKRVWVKLGKKWNF